MSARILMGMKTTRTTPASMTFRYTFCDREIGSDYTHTETVYEDGRVESHFLGRDNGEHFNKRTARRVDGPLDLAKVKAAREMAGWTTL